MSDTENTKWHTHKSKTASINKLKEKLLRLLNFCSQNSISAVADTSNSSWFKFVKSIDNHSFFNFQVAQYFSAVSW